MNAETETEMQPKTKPKRSTGNSKAETRWVITRRKPKMYNIILFLNQESYIEIHYS